MGTRRDVSYCALVSLADSHASFGPRSYGFVAPKASADGSRLRSDMARAAHARRPLSLPSTAHRLGYRWRSAPHHTPGWRRPVSPALTCEIRTHARTHAGTPNGREPVGIKLEERAVWPNPRASVPNLMGKRRPKRQLQQGQGQECDASPATSTSTSTSTTTSATATASKLVSSTGAPVSAAPMLWPQSVAEAQ